MVSINGVSMTPEQLPASQRTASRELTQQDFLKIMIEQMKGQNPLSSEGGTEDFFAQLVQFQTLESMQSMTKAVELLANVSSLSQSAALLGRSVTAEVATTNEGGLTSTEIVQGAVRRVTFDEVNGATVELDSGLLVPMNRVTAVE